MMKVIGISRRTIKTKAGNDQNVCTLYLTGSRDGVQGEYCEEAFVYDGSLVPADVTVGTEVFIGRNNRGYITDVMAI